MFGTHPVGARHFPRAASKPLAPQLLLGEGDTAARRSSPQYRQRRCAGFASFRLTSWSNHGSVTCRATRANVRLKASAFYRSVTSRRPSSVIIASPGLWVSSPAQRFSSLIGFAQADRLVELFSTNSRKKTSCSALAASCLASTQRFLLPVTPARSYLRASLLFPIAS